MKERVYSNYLKKSLNIAFIFIALMSILSLKPVISYAQEISSDEIIETVETEQAVSADIDPEPEEQEAIPVKMGEPEEVEPLAAALESLPAEYENYILGNTVNLTLENDYSGKWYRFNMDKSGIVRMNVYGTGTDIFIYDENGNDVDFAYLSTKRSDFTTLLKGSYYCYFKANKGDGGFKIANYDPANDYQTFEESYNSTNRNDSKNTATVISEEGVYHGVIGCNNFQDWYRLELSKETYVQITEKDYATYYDAGIYLFRADGETKVLYTCRADNIQSTVLPAGTWYVCARKASLDPLYSEYGVMSYKFVVGQQAKENESAYVLPNLNGIETYTLGEEKSVDFDKSEFSQWYVFTLDKSSIIKVTLNATSSYPTLFINELSGTNIEAQRNSGVMPVGLMAGTYYLKLTGGAYNLTGTVSFKMEAVEPSSNLQTYPEKYLETKTRNNTWADSSITNVSVNEVTTQKKISGILSYDNTFDCFKVNTTSPVKLKFTQRIYYDPDHNSTYNAALLTIYNKTRETRLLYKNDSTIEFILAKGEYYICASRYNEGYENGYAGGSVAYDISYDYIPKYNMIYDPNGAPSDLVKTVKTPYYDGTEVNIPDVYEENDLAKTNFLGWSKDKNASTPDYKKDSKITISGKDETLYAVWKKPWKKVTLDLDVYHDTVTPSDYLKNEDATWLYEFSLPQKTMLNISLMLNEALKEGSKCIFTIYDDTGKIISLVDDTGSIDNPTNVDLSYKTGNEVDNTKMIFRRIIGDGGKYYITIQEQNSSRIGTMPEWDWISGLSASYGIYISSYRATGFDLVNDSIPVINAPTFFESNGNYFTSNTVQNTFKKNYIFKKFSIPGGHCMGLSLASIINYSNKGALYIPNSYINPTINKNGKDIIWGYNIPSFKGPTGLGEIVNELCLMQSSTEWKDWRKKNGITNVVSIAKSSHNPILILVSWSDGGHAVVTDSKRTPLYLGNDWYRIYVYDNNTPYDTTMSNGDNSSLIQNIVPQGEQIDKGYKKALNSYIDINEKTGDFDFYGGINADISQTLYGQGQPRISGNNKTAATMAAYGDPISNQLWGDLATSLNNKCTYNAFGNVGLSLFEGDLDVKLNDRIIYRKTNNQVIIKDDIIEEVPIIGYSVIDNESGSFSRLFFPVGNYEYSLDNGNIDYCIDNGLIEIETSDPINMKFPNETSAILRSDNTGAMSRISITRSDGNDKYCLVKTNIALNDEETTITLSNDNKLSIDSPIEQKIDITIETESGNEIIQNVSTDDIENLDIINGIDETFNISFDSQGGSSVDKIEGIAKNTTIKLPIPTKDGYSFDGWYTEPNGKGTKYTDQTPITNSLTLYAYWIENTEDPDPDITILSGNGIVIKQKINVNTLFSETYGVSFKKYVVYPKGAASIDSKGVLAAKKAGEITVTACNKSGKKWIPDTEKTIKINIEKPAFKSKTIVSKIKGLKIDGAGNIKDSTIAPTKWISSKPKIVTVDENTGLIKIVGKGISKITLVYGTGKQAAKYSFTVKANIPVISKSKVSMLTGATYKLKLNNTMIKPEWNSSDTTKATVADGKVTALSAGEVIISAKVDGVDYTSTITVKPPAIKKTALSVKVGKSVKVGLKNTKLKQIKWVSSDTSIATVDNSGKVIGIKPGTAIISTEAGGVVSKCTITVK